MRCIKPQDHKQWQCIIYYSSYKHKIQRTSQSNQHTCTLCIIHRFRCMTLYTETTPYRYSAHITWQRTHVHHISPTSAHTTPIFTCHTWDGVTSVTVSCATYNYMSICVTRRAVCTSVNLYLPPWHHRIPVYTHQLPPPHMPCDLICISILTPCVIAPSAEVALCGGADLSKLL